MYGDYVGVYSRLYSLMMRLLHRFELCRMKGNVMEDGRWLHWCHWCGNRAVRSPEVLSISANKITWGTISASKINGEDVTYKIKEHD